MSTSLFFLLEIRISKVHFSPGHATQAAAPSSCPSRGGTRLPSAHSCEPVRGHWGFILHHPEGLFNWEKVQPEQLSRASCTAGAAPALRETAPTHLWDLFSLFPAPRLAPARGECAWMAGGLSGAAERSLRCLSPSLAEALPNHQRFGEEERPGRAGRLVFILEGWGEGERELPSAGPCPCPGRRLLGCRVGTMGWLSSCRVEQLSLVWQWLVGCSLMTCCLPGGAGHEGSLQGFWLPGAGDGFS